MSSTANTSQSPYLPNQRFFPDESQYLQRELNNSYSDVAKAVNARDIAIYSQSEVATGQRFDFIPDARTQEAKRKVIMFGAIPANGVAQTVPHRITGFSTFTRIYGVGTNGTVWRPLPYASNTANNLVELFVNRTDVTIINGAAAVAFTSAIVVLEFV